MDPEYLLCGSIHADITCGERKYGILVYRAVMRCAIYGRHF